MAVCIVFLTGSRLSVAMRGGTSSSMSNDDDGALEADIADNGVFALDEYDEEDIAGSLGNGDLERKMAARLAIRRRHLGGSVYRGSPACAGAHIQRRVDKTESVRDAMPAVKERRRGRHKRYFGVEAWRWVVSMFGRTGVKFDFDWTHARVTNEKGTHSR